jgi:integrase
MNTTKPIKSLKDVQRFKHYYLKKGEYRNYLLVSVCLNSALRISDVLNLRWEDFYNFNTSHFKTHIEITELKTGKATSVLINRPMLDAIKLYLDKCSITLHKGYIFTANGVNHITRVQAHRIVKAGGKSIGLEVSCHSLRKTFGYHAWKKGVPPALLTEIYNHSDFEVTKRYLGIEQEDKDSVFRSVEL